MFEVFIISCRDTVTRLPHLITASSLLDYNMTIIREEEWPTNTIFNPTQWNLMAESLESVQIDNLKRIKRNFADFKIPEFRNLRKSEVSIYSKHLLAMTKLISSRSNYALILEDDVLVESECSASLHELVVRFKPYFCDICHSPGLGTKNASQTNLDRFLCDIEHVSPPRTRNACAYIIDKSFATFFTNQPYHYILPYDWSLSFFMIEYNIPVLWVDGLPILHGSQSGIYSSTSKQ